jgi:hypothetical protein
MSINEIQNEYQEQDEEDFEEFKEWKAKERREKGILEDGSPLGESVHKDTIKSYAKLKMVVPDNVRLTTLRPNERYLRMLTEMGNRPEIKTTIRKIYRLNSSSWSQSSIFLNCIYNFR